MRRLTRIKEKLRPLHKRLSSNPIYRNTYQAARSFRVSLDVRQGSRFANAYERLPLDQNVVVYESFHATSMSCSPKALFKTLINDPTKSHLQHYWIVDNPAHIDPAYKNLKNVRFVDRRSRLYPRLLATAGLVVNNSTFPYWYVRRDGQKYANTWHGVPLKNMFKTEGSARARYANSQRNFLQASHIFLQNDYTSRKILGACDVLPLVCDRTFEIGAPRIDATIGKKETVSKTKNILYAPTWRGALGDANALDSEVETLIAEINAKFGADCKVFLKLHNFVTREHLRPSLDVELVASHVDANELMAKMDIVISDYSSIMIDAMAADIPTILYTYDLAYYSFSRGLSVDLVSLPVALCESEGAVLEAIKAPRAPSSFDRQFESAKSKLFDLEDGKASERMVDILFGDQAKVMPKASKEKDILMFFGGGWKKNGISTSAMNLFKNLDYQKHHIVLLTDGQALGKDAWDYIDELPKDILIIHRVGKESFTKSETLAKIRYYANNTLGNAKSEALLVQTMTREMRRIVGDLQVQAAVDFSAYRRLWSFLISQANAKKKLILQHNELYSEATSVVKNHQSLFGVFAVYKFFDKILCVSEETKEKNLRELREFYANEDQAGVITNTVDAELVTYVKSISKRKITFDGEEFLPVGLSEAKDQGTLDLTVMKKPDPRKTNFVTLGRFSEEKNHAMLLRAFAKVVAKRTDVALYILGEGPLWEETYVLRDALGLRDYVYLPGFLKMGTSLLNECSCFVLPSKYEGQPMVLLEAMSLNKPVIATDIPGSRSLLKNGEGVLTPEGDPDVFAQAMLDFCDGKLNFTPFDVKRHNQEAITGFYEQVSG